MLKKVEYIFKAIDVAEVSIADLAFLTGVSRESLYRWKKGNNVKDRLRLNIAYMTAQRLETACRLGKLPLKDKLKKDKRRSVLRITVSKMAAKTAIIRPAK